MRNLVKLASAVAVVVFVAVLALVPDAGVLDGASKAMSAAAIACVLYDKVLWKYMPFEKNPRLLPEYECTIRYDHEMGRGVKTSKVKVRQTLLSINLSFSTNEVYTYSTSADIVEEYGNSYLQYCYKTEPDAAYSEKNPSQLGACRLRIECRRGVHPKAERLVGTYWTNRRTTGDIEFRQRGSA